MEKPYQPAGHARPMFVDLELRRVDLDRINSLGLPGVEVIGTCAGHLSAHGAAGFDDWDNPRPWIALRARYSKMCDYVTMLIVYGTRGRRFVGWHIKLLGTSGDSFSFRLEPAEILLGSETKAARWWAAASLRLKRMADDYRRNGAAHFLPTPPRRA